ncbi:MAG: Rqc2 family fibronectin-binding protein [Candidatus Xenobia bacterium]
MKLDAILLRCLVAELQPLVGARLRKISQLTRDDYLLTFWAPGECFLFISCGDAPRLVRVEGSQKPSAETPSAFCMLLRKHLEGARLEKIEQAGLERMVLLHFPDHVLAFNLIERKLHLRTAVETFPDGTTVPLHLEGEPLWKGLARGVFGLNGHAAREICLQAGRDPNGPAGEDEALQTAFAAFCERFHQGPWQPLYKPDLDVGLPWDYESLRARPGEAFDSFNAMLMARCGTTWSTGRVDARRAAVRAQIEKLLFKVRRRLDAHTQEMAGLGDPARWRLMGELLLAHQGSVPAGSREVMLEDWNSGEMVRIPLDAELTVSANAQYCFARYRKAQRGAEVLQGRLAQARGLLAWLEEAQVAAEMASEVAELDDISATLKGVGAVAGEKAKRPAAAKGRPAAPRRYHMEGWEILVGRTPRQNEELALRNAHPDDLWFHAREIPGCHVLLRQQGHRAPPERVLRAAATLAAQFSKGCASGRVDVVMTKARHLRKPPQSPPGTVTYRQEQTRSVRTDADSLASVAAELQPV